MEVPKASFFVRQLHATTVVPTKESSMLSVVTISRASALVGVLIACGPSGQVEVGRRNADSNRDAIGEADSSASVQLGSAFSWATARSSRERRARHPGRKVDASFERRPSFSGVGRARRVDVRIERLESQVRTNRQHRERTCTSCFVRPA